jgi:hypothetical protein
VPHASEPGAAYGSSYPGASNVGSGGGHAAYIQQQTAYAYPMFQQQQLPATLPAYGQPASGYGSGTLMDSITAPQVRPCC